MGSYIGVAPPQQTGVVERYQFTGNGSTTAFSGADNNAKILRYTSTNPVLVFLNGVQLISGSDFSKTSDTVLTFTTAPASSDEIEIMSFGSFDLKSPNTIRSDLNIELTSGKMLVGNSSNLTVPVTPSGDVSVSNTGAMTVSTIGGTTAYNIPGKVEGTNFIGSLLVGHATTGTLSSADRNTSVGISALDAITSGDENVVVGHSAGTAITSGQYNTYIGGKAGFTQVAGTNNVGVGRYAGYYSTGSQNTAVGSAAMTGNGNYEYNTAIGAESLKAVTTGDYNIGLGRQSGDNITTGSGNVIIGTADAGSATGSRQLKITGYDGTTTTTWIDGDSSGNVTFPADVEASTLNITGGPILGVRSGYGHSLKLTRSDTGQYLQISPAAYTDFRFDVSGTTAFTITTGGQFIMGTNRSIGSTEEIFTLQNATFIGAYNAAGNGDFRVIGSDSSDNIVL